MQQLHSTPGLLIPDLLMALAERGYGVLTAGAHCSSRMPVADAQQAAGADCRAVHPCSAQSLAQMNQCQCKPCAAGLPRAAQELMLQAHEACAVPVLVATSCMAAAVDTPVNLVVLTAPYRGLSTANGQPNVCSAQLLWCVGPTCCLRASDCCRQALACLLFAVT